MMYYLTAPILTGGAYPFVSTTIAHATIRPKLSIQRIKEAVSSYYDVAISSLNSARRDRGVARPRQIAMYLAKELTPKSLPVIGREFDRDHTTVIHAIKQIERLRIIDGDIADDLVVLRARLTA